MKEPIMQFFEYSHLPGNLQQVARPFSEPMNGPHISEEEWAEADAIATAWAALCDAAEAFIDTHRNSTATRGEIWQATHALERAAREYGSIT